MKNINQLGLGIYQDFQLNSKDTIVVAVSGGVDSMTLVTALVSLDASRRPKIVLAHINHQLREQSTEEEAYLRQWSQQHSVIMETIKWPMDDHPEHGVENAARQFRYKFFTEIVQKYHARYLFTAHNADDQVETFLMRLVRGGRLSELTGIAVKRDFTQDTVLGRPLLEYAKADLKRIAQANNIQWFEDETNQTNDYLRNRMRHNVVPQLKAENKKFLQHLADYQNQIATDNELIETILKEKIQQISLESKFDLKEYQKQSEAWRLKILAAINERMTSNVELKRQLVKDQDQFLMGETSQGSLDVGQGWLLQKTYDTFDFKNEVPETVKSNDQPMERVLVLNHWFNMNSDQQIMVTDQPISVNDHLIAKMELTANQIQLPLLLKPALSSIQFSLKGGGHKSVRRELIDQKISNDHRSEFLAIFDRNDQLIWVPNLRKNWLTNKFQPELKKYTVVLKSQGD